MAAITANQIWVFGDLRSRALLDTSLKVLVKAAGLAAKTESRVSMFLLTPGETGLLTVADDDTCAIQGSVEEEAFARGADGVKGVK